MTYRASILASAFCLLVFSLIAAPAAAQDAAKGEDPIAKLEKQTTALLEGLDEEELKYVYATRMRDGTLRAVRYISGLVSGASEACSEAHPDMKESLDARYERWWGTLKPLMEEAEANLERTIAAEDNPSPEQIREHLKLVDEAAEFTRAKSERQYVTTPEACQYLLENMDKTEEDLARKLQETLVSIPLPQPETKTPDDKAGTGEEAEAKEDDQAL